MASLLASLSGLFAAVLLFAPVPNVEWLRAWHTFAPVRVLAAPVFILAFSPGLLPAAGANRKWSVLACAFEVVTMGAFAVLVASSRIRGY